MKGRGLQRSRGKSREYRKSLNDEVGRGKSRESRKSLNDEEGRGKSRESRESLKDAQEQSCRKYLTCKQYLGNKTLNKY